MSGERPSNPYAFPQWFIARWAASAILGLWCGLWCDGCELPETGSER